MKWLRYFTCLFLLIAHSSIAQKPFVVPIEFTSDFIIVQVRINRVPMHFIFDTGSEHSILFKREVADLLDLKLDRRIQVFGADLSDSIFAYVSRRVQLDLDPLPSKQSDILIMEESITHLDKLTGRNIDGILGSQFFKHYKFQIDYQRSQIRFYKDLPEKKLTNHTKCSIRLRKNKPYMTIPISFDGKDALPLNLLFDTGASVRLMLHSNTHESICLPSNSVSTVLGAGVGGLILGHLGRVQSMQICDFKLQNQISNFQDISLINVDSSKVFRHGVIGNGILKKFNVLFDYNDNAIYLKPTKSFKSKQDFDKSGILLGSTGVTFNEHIIIHVMKNSPAQETGLKRGDKLLKINGMRASQFTLSEIMRKFRKKEGRTVRLVINRNGEILKKKILLRELI